MPEKWFLARGVDLAALSSALQDPRLEWVYAERMEDTILAEIKDLSAQGVELDQWEHGRAFGPQIEIAWWRASLGFDLRAIVEEGKPPQGPQWAPDPLGDDFTRIEKKSNLLIGERDKKETSNPPAWSTARIPRYLYYPLKGEPTRRVALTFITYQIDGLCCEQRLIGLEGVADNG